MNFDQWAVWKRAFVLNAAGAVGVALGFALGGVNLSPKYQVPIAVFILSFVNLMFLPVRPRILANKAAGIRSVAALRLLLDVLRERPAPQ